jgi:hypothetical protein
MSSCTAGTGWAGIVLHEAGHRYFLNGQLLPGVTSVLSVAGLLNYDFLPAALREECLSRGRAVHQVTRDDDEGNLAESSVPPEIRGYVEGWRRFRQDYDFQPSLVEHKVCNPQYGYGGCIDRTGRTRDGAEVILDLKTGVAPAAVAIQLAAYSACLEHPRTRLRRCVELHQNGGYKVIPYQTSDFQRDFNEFLAALETYRAREEK